MVIAGQTWYVEAKVVWCSNLAFGRFGRFGRLCARCYARPSCPNYPGEASLVRPRTQIRGLLRQVPQSGANFSRAVSNLLEIQLQSPKSRARRRNSSSQPERRHTITRTQTLPPLSKAVVWTVVACRLWKSAIGYRIGLQDRIDREENRNLSYHAIGPM